MSKLAARLAVRKGAALMPLLDLEWYECIDTRKLNLADSQQCVLGQWAEANLPSAYPDLHHTASYGEARALLNEAVGEYISATEFGFDRLNSFSYTELNEAWREVIIYLQEEL